MASKTQELFKCVCGEDVTDENPIKLISKEDIIQDMKTRAAVSDFSPLKQAILVKYFMFNIDCFSLSLEKQNDKFRVLEKC